VSRVVLALVLLLALGCSGGADDDGERARPGEGSSTTGTSEPEAETTTSTAPATPQTETLARLMVDDVLPGFTRVGRDDRRFVTGPLDLEAAAREERDVEAERSLLQTRHFVAGEQGAWTNPDDDVVVVTLYRFATPGDAAAYLADGREAVEARAVQPFAVPDIPGAFGFTSVDDRGDVPFTAHAVAFTNGDVYALVNVGSNRSGPTPDEARQIAAAQAAKLTASARS
jgi:hypothetical protein